MSGLDVNDPDFQYLVVDRKKLMKEQTQTFDGKKACWIPDKKEGFLAAEIQSSKGDEITVKTTETNEVGIGFLLNVNIHAEVLWVGLFPSITI